MGNFKNRLTATGPRSCLAHKSLTSTWVEKRAPLALTLHLPCTYPALHREGGGHGTVSHAGAKKGGPEACLGGGDTAPSVMQAQKRVGPPPLPCTRPTYPALAPQACLGGGDTAPSVTKAQKRVGPPPLPCTYPALTLHYEGGRDVGHQGAGGKEANSCPGGYPFGPVGWGGDRQGQSPRRGWKQTQPVDQVRQPRTALTLHRPPRKRTFPCVPVPTLSLPHRARRRLSSPNRAVLLGNLGEEGLTLSRS